MVDLFGGRQARCSAYCRCTEHADDIIAVITRGTTHQIKSFIEARCANGAQVSDALGRNALHIAASCGKVDVVDWLITEKHVELKSRDLESAWTAIHRSLFYGQINCAVLLARCGCNLYKQDIEGLTPLDLVMKDQPSYVEYSASGPTECYTWGANTNFTLGHSNQHSRKHPELVEELVKKGFSIKQIVMCKFHTILLTHCGKVLTCGHGQGGRLGLGDEHTYLVPHLVDGLGDLKCTQVAAGRDHIVFLCEGGLVYTCGQNDYHQLGLSLGITCYVPKSISLKNLKGKVVVGVAAGRFHTVLYTTDVVYTFGLNAGQLGHPKDDKYQLNPRQVTSLHHKDFKICALATSDAATVCATTKGDIYALHEYQCRKIASKCLNIKKLAVFGGHLDSDVEQTMLQKQGGDDLHVVALNNSGTVFVWKVSDRCLKRCVWDVKCQLFVSDIAINKHGIVICTTQGQGLLGFMSKKGHQIRDVKSKVLPTSPDAFSVAVRAKHTDKEDVELVHLERIPFVHRGVHVTCDKSGKNFSFLQSDPKTSLVEIPLVRASVMSQECAALFKEVNPCDNIHDVILKVGTREWPAHKYILSARSEYFKKMFFQEATDKKDEVENDGGNLMEESAEVVVVGDVITAPILDLLLQFIYEDQCDLFKPGFKYSNEGARQNITADPVRSNVAHDISVDGRQSAYAVNQELKKAGKARKKEGRKQKNQTNEGKDDLTLAVKLLQNAAKQFKVSRLTQRLEGVKVQNGQLQNVKKSKKKISFNRNQCSYLADVILEAEDGTTFSCHKCVLVARLEYFHSMLASGWIETSSKTALKLPMSSKALSIILDYLYTDEAVRLRECQDIEFLCNLLTVADQLLITRLKELCEVAITNLISLKNAAELLEFSTIYQADQLKNTCHQYIGLNLPVLIESQVLDVLSTQVMDELTKSYKEMIPGMSRRIITPYADCPDLSLYTRSEDDTNVEMPDKNNEATQDFHMTHEQAARKAKARRRARKSSARKQSVSVSESVDGKSENEDKLRNSICEISEVGGADLQPLEETANSLEVSASQCIVDGNDNVQKMDVDGGGDLKLVRQDFSDRYNSELEPGLWGWKSPPQRETHTSLNGLREIMQSQSKTTSASRKTPVKAAMPSGKKSQKQKKKELQLMSQKTDSGLPQETVPEPVASPWGKEAECTPTKSFRELLIAEKKHEPVSRHVTMATSPPPSSTRGSEILGWGIARRSKPDLQIDTQMSTASNTAANEHINPWLARSPQSPDENAVKFKAILESEQQHKQNLDKTLHKSFSLIQIEDRAVQELLLHYNAVGNPEEVITVERVSKVTAVPVWKKEKR